MPDEQLELLVLELELENSEDVRSHAKSLLKSGLFTRGFVFLISPIEARGGFPRCPEGAFAPRSILNRCRAVRRENSETPESSNDLPDPVPIATDGREANGVASVGSDAPRILSSPEEELD